MIQVWLAHCLFHLCAAPLQEALTLGIPSSAIPELPAQPTAQDLRTARERLEGMVQSFLSAAL